MPRTHSMCSLAQRAVALLSGLLILLSACATPKEDPARTWSYTDDRGIKVTSAGTPKRIVAQVSAAAALQDFGVPIVGTFGPLRRDDGSTEPEAGNIVPSKVTDVTGSGYGEVNLERLAALRPDLLVSGKYAEFPGLWHLTEQQEQLARRIVPTVGVQQSGIALPETISRYRDLARALGADVESAEVRAAEQRFHDASNRLRALGSRMRAEGRTILAVGGTRQEYYVVVPGRNPDLDYYVEELGLPIVTPKRPDESGGGYFERLSWENAGAYSGDVLLWDTRPASMPPERMKQNPVFAALPAAARNRFVGWDAVAPMSYASYAEIMTKLADQIERVLPPSR